MNFKEKVEFVGPRLQLERERVGSVWAATIERLQVWVSAHRVAWSLRWPSDDIEVADALGEATPAER